MITKSLYVILFFVSGLLILMSTVEEEKIEIVSSKITIKSPPCLQMYKCIEKYAKMYKIPRHLAYGCAYEETHYCGPFHWKYDQRQGSYAGALGPMQLMPPTARGMWPEVPRDSIPDKRIMNDIEFNVHTSMKFLRQLHNKYKDWSIVFGYYNSGIVQVNDYARRIVVFQPEKHWY